ncbi:MAG: UDP-glucose 4-epimerase GalE [Alphaproteobacteria bacterium]
MTILVTGGAGYIGSHIAHALSDRCEDIVVLDNLSAGLRALIPAGAQFVAGDVGDGALLAALFTKYRFDAILHFAGSIVVPESVADPLSYCRNNTSSARTLIEAAVKANVKCFVFSSTAAVYGDPSRVPAQEDDATVPISPYGRSKLMVEWMLADAAKAHGLRYVALCYFNVAGADAQGRTGQSGPNQTHSIKRACLVAVGRISFLEIFGMDYPTADGTCVRDYVHVGDLVTAHLLALDYLRKGGSSGVFNCGYGHGFSVREVIASVERAIHYQLPVREAPRRPGDPAILLSDPTRIKSVMGFRPQLDDLDGIVRSTLAWEERHAKDVVS